MRFTQQHILNALFLCIAALGAWIIYAILDVNTIRGDEFLSYLHSDPRWSYPEIIAHIHGGADNSYVHAVLLRWFFEMFGHTIVVQRTVSAIGWVLGLWAVYGSVRFIEWKKVRYVILMLIGFSNFGFFLATDGRFYSWLFCWAALSFSIYVNRYQFSKSTSLILFAVVQLLGLLTSASFLIFQLLFSLALLGVAIYKRSEVRLPESLKWLGCVLVTAIIYFTWLKIPYYHSYFFKGIFTAGSFNLNELKTFVSIPFRWLFLPHVPGASDEVDGVVFLMTVIGVLFYFRKPIFKQESVVSEREQLLGLMAIGILAGMGIQLLLYAVKGYPLWEGRYYAIVFFFIPIALGVFLRNVLSNKLIMVCACLWLTRLVMVEYPKIEIRRSVLASVNQLQQTIMAQSKPTLFLEHMDNKQSSLFGQMGNVYVRYPQTREKLFLMSDPSVPERTAYFKRLSEWHYPVGLVFEYDTSHFKTLVP